MFSDFRLISPSDNGYLKDMFASAGKESWCYFPPFLNLYSLLPSRPVYIYEQPSFTIIAQKVTNRREERLDLLIPPVSLNDNSVEWLNEVIDYLIMHTQQSDLRILWVDESDLEFLSNRFGESLKYKLKDRDYLYEPQKVFDKKGREFRDLRKKINRVARLDPVFNEIQSQDLKPAENLLKDWRKNQGRKREFLLDWGYTMSSLKRFYEFSRSELRGWQVSVSGSLRGFALAGPISNKVGCFFVVKTDTQIDGLSEYLRWKVFSELLDHSLVNDAGDLGLPGLRQHKMKMRPSRIDNVYSVNLTRTGSKKYE
tara:strand:+ start:161 stop:1096 length:936 start_codon:yes stop_codon:yes gene_type:complete